MDNIIELVKAEKKDIEVIKHLWDLYSYDFSVYDGDDVNEQATYNFNYGDHYFDSDERFILFVIINKKYAGFVSINNTCYVLNQPNDRTIVDFFIMNKYRRGGIGRTVAERIFSLYPGRWEIIQWDNNETSKVFWEKVISQYTNNHYEIRKIFTKEMTLQAIIFDSVTHEDSEPDLVKSIKNYTVKLYRQPEESIINQIISIIETNINCEDTDIPKSIRKDLKYQDVMTLEDDDSVISFIIHTCIKGQINITNIGTDISNKNKGYASTLLREFKQKMKLAGFDTIIVEMPNPNNDEKYISTANMYEKNDFKLIEKADDYYMYQSILV